MAGNVTLQFAGLASGYCMTTFNQLGLDIITATSAALAGNTNTFNYGNSTPSAGNQDKPWLRLNSDGTIDRWYSFSSGLWLSPHYQCPGQVIMYEGTEASIDTFDGGEAGAITAMTGPFWEKVTSLNARSPIGPGTLPTTTVINIGDDIGDEQHTNALSEMILHHHPIKAHASAPILGGDGGAILNHPTPGTDYDANTEDAGSATPTPFSIIHPCHAIWFIRRSGRLYYRI